MDFISVGERKLVYRWVIGQPTKPYVKEMRKILSSQTWKVPTTICWGLRDRWLSYDGVEDFCRSFGLKVVELPMAGHHVQEDCGEDLGRIIAEVITTSS